MYSYKHLYENQLSTPYKFILFDNSFYIFTLYIHHNFIIQFNTTSYFTFFKDFFQHNIFLGSFFGPYFNTVSYVAPFQS